MEDDGTEHVLWTDPTDQIPTRRDIVDVDADSHLDVVIVNRTTGENVATFLGNGDGTFHPK